MKNEAQYNTKTKQEIEVLVSSLFFELCLKMLKKNHYNTMRKLKYALAAEFSPDYVYMNGISNI